MKKVNADMIERIIAIGVVLIGAGTGNWIIAGIGIAYFITKM